MTWLREIRERYPITDEEALYIKEVTEEKVQDANIRETVEAHKEDLTFLRDTFEGQVNRQIQGSYGVRQLFDEPRRSKIYRDGSDLRHHGVYGRSAPFV